MSWGYGYPAYVTIAQKKANAQTKLIKLKQEKKYGDIEPIIIEGNAITSTWWGKAWCKNLERYSDYANRIGRGRSYVKNGFIFDLKIHPGKIISLVQGSGSNPYKCEIKIEPISAGIWNNIKKLTESNFDSIQTLLHGKFPKELQEILSAEGKGIFPCPKEISFDCSCPDWADMCKHIAASLYGVGSKLDKFPELLFTLRGVNMNDLIGSTLQSHKNSIIEKASKVKSSRIIAIKNQPLSDMFGIDFKE